MNDIWIYVITFFSSLLTLVSGFGLGTILTPVFTLIYDVKLAILLVAIVHSLNNAFKFLLFRSHVDIAIIKRFGLLSIVGAFAGASLQNHLFSEALKVFLGIVLLLLGVKEILPSKMEFSLPRRIDVLGGFLSGLLGGLVGNQGAIRSAYLLNYDVTKETFIATSTVIALTIDATRIPVYVVSQQGILSQVGWNIVPVIIIAFAGTMIGKQFLKSITSGIFKKIVASFVMLMGALFTLRIL